jgi:hypothetical protein
VRGAGQEAALVSIFGRLVCRECSRAAERTRDEEIDMRKVVLFANTSLDGFMSGKGGDMSWMVDDEDKDHEFTTDIRHRADTILTGRATYQCFEGAWPAMAEVVARRRAR